MIMVQFWLGTSLQIDCDKTIMVTLKHDEKLQDGAECSFQAMTISFWLFKFHNIFFTKKFHTIFSILLSSPFCLLQCALLYTTVDGQRRIRVSTLSLPCTTILSNLFRSADLDTQFACFLKHGSLFPFNWCGLWWCEAKIYLI